MVGTKATRTLAGKMERARLEAQTLDELRQEALKYQLPISSDRTRLIETILLHFEQNSPLDEMLPATQRPRTQSARSRIGSGHAEQSAVSTASPAQAVTLLAPQIPEYGGTDKENIHVWTQKVDRVAQVHRAFGDVVLLAASSKLTKMAKQWYEMQSGHVLESWSELKRALTKMFDRRISFKAAMQRIEARKWNSSKESFDQYAIDKLALIHRLDLPSTDTINLIIGGIQHSSLRAKALTLTTHSVDQFLEAMRRITYRVDEFEKKNLNQHKGAKNKDSIHRGSDSKTHGQRDSKVNDGVCNYCKKKGHWKANCLALKRKERTAATTSSPSPTAKAASPSQPTTAALAETKKDKFYLSGPLVKINNINNINCNLNALMDTGSPVSFIALDNFSRFFGLSVDALEPVDRKFNALPKTPINVLEKINSLVRFEDFPDRTFQITLHVDSPDFSDMNLIIGRDFLEDHELTLIFRPSKSSSNTFTQLLLQTDVCYTGINTESMLDECEIDFGLTEKQQLKDTILNCMNMDASMIDDDYCTDSSNMLNYHSEALAEFQKRIVQILQPFIREDKILVYIDDILIASRSVEENLNVLREVLLTLRKYGFELNFAKCKFLKKKIEFLGYIISRDQITMSDRHTQAIKSFPVPKNVHQLQRFLGLANYFRKFIQDYARKARPLHNLLRKTAEFDFDLDCVTAFELLKKELTAYPVLHLYNLAAQTELHTDASSQGLGAILLQKQSNAKWETRLHILVRQLIKRKRSIIASSLRCSPL
ncbi:hypothetical protein RF55_8496 [Lasius niger]|uniref:Reverse transcriptase domain-containing protein n=1 Tax=Lasius niger TaxID=67767 RepID=A0A0J7KMM6_LASNI|nr:hypothetical protein RF55_8496 [Lasius niger]